MAGANDSQPARCYWCLESISPNETSYIQSTCSVDSCGTSTFHFECAKEIALSGRGSKTTKLEPSTKWKEKVRHEALTRPDRTLARGMCPVGRNPKLHDEVLECKGVVLQCDVVQPVKAKQEAHPILPAPAPFVSRKARRAAAAAAGLQPAAPPKAAGNSKATKAKKKMTPLEHSVGNEHFQICKWVERGMPCAKGKSCPFAHSAEELESRVEAARYSFDAHGNGGVGAAIGFLGQHYTSLATPQMGAEVWAVQQQYQVGGRKSMASGKAPKTGKQSVAARTLSGANPWLILGGDEGGSGSVSGGDDSGEDGSGGGQWPGGPVPDFDQTLQDPEPRPVSAADVAAGDHHHPNNKDHQDEDQHWEVAPPAAYEVATRASPVVGADNGYGLTTAAVDAMRAHKRASTLDGLKFRLRALENMGFSSGPAGDALLACDGNLERAADLLLSGTKLPSKVTDGFDVSDDVSIVVAACLAQGRDPWAVSADIIRAGGDYLEVLSGFGLLDLGGEGGETGAAAADDVSTQKGAAAVVSPPPAAPLSTSLPQQVGYQQEQYNGYFGYQHQQQVPPPAFQLASTPVTSPPPPLAGTVPLQPPLANDDLLSKGRIQVVEEYDDLLSTLMG